MARLVSLVGLEVGSLFLAGYTGTVALSPAPAATSVGCAGIIVRLPAAIGEAQKRETDAQGTAAWGSPVSVVLRCGITPPGPTTRTCYTISGVDWLTSDQPNQRYELETFGRIPAPQILIDARRTPVSEALPAASDAISAAMPHAAGQCTGRGAKLP